MVNRQHKTKARKKQTVSWRVLSIFIGIGVLFLAQMVWWIIFFISFVDIKEHPRYVRMIIWEGGFFILLILAGLFTIYRIFKHELSLKQQFKDFFAAFSHELKTPIAAIKLQLETIQTRQLPEEQQQKLISNMIEDTDALELSLDNILDAFRYDSGAIRLDRHRVNFDNWLEETVNKVLIPHSQTSLKVERDFASGAKVAIDERYMNSVVSNLILNSIRYSNKTNPEIQIETLRSDDILIWKYRDNGLGIEPHEAEDIFQRFYRSDQAHSLEHKGSGIGLFLTKKIVEAHDGKIQAIGTGTGNGIQFIITLPVATENE
jgi:signal transduction histidine kinase